jgi:hypothetical protein
LFELCDNGRGGGSRKAIVTRDIVYVTSIRDNQILRSLFF